MPTIFPSILPGKEDRVAFEPSNPQGLTTQNTTPAAEQIANGICPWCDVGTDREFENVGAHASSSHPDDWANYKTD